MIAEQLAHIGAFLRDAFIGGFGVVLSATLPRTAPALLREQARKSRVK
jgi:hypothetical protein